MLTDEGKQINISRLRQQKHKFFNTYWSYKRVFWEHFPYDILQNMIYIQKPSQKDKSSYNDVVIMFDTESSKKPKGEENHICAWSLAIRAYDKNICTLWGRKPSDLIECMKRIHENLKGDHTIFYCHNLGWDHIFLRKFFYREFGIPIKQLNVKPFVPIYIEYENGIIIRDSLILSGCSLEKWAEDMRTEHGKAVGKWDYDKIRNQSGSLFSPDEMLYIENDVLAGVECIDKLKETLGKKIYNMPWTMTGIVRESLYHAGVPHKAHKEFLKIAPTYEQLRKLEKVYHGGYTHGNRHFYGYVIKTKDGWEHVRGYDFASSYPYVMLTEKYPCQAFKPEKDLRIDEILESSDEYAYMFKLVLFRPELRSDKIPMPVLSISKATKVINPISDNGRLVQADYFECYCNEVDLQQVKNCYRYDEQLSICQEVEYAKKDYLPRWITDFVYQLFEEKCKLKGKDPVLYALAKARLNSIYGLFVQHPCKPDILEDYFYNEESEAPLFHVKDECYEDEFMRKKYQSFLDNRKSILPYFVGCWVTSYAMKNLFLLASCIDYKGTKNGYKGEWLYSDTDSIYCIGMDPEKLAAYNDRCKKILIERGYPAVKLPGSEKEYWLGIAEHDPEEDEYSEFVYVGAKRYTGRCTGDGKLHTTVAGVPKFKKAPENLPDIYTDKKTGRMFVGSYCMQNNIDNFVTGFIFDGRITGKKTHKHFIVPEIYVDEWGNECGDSVDLSPCDYKLKAAEDPDWDPFAPMEIEVQNYELEE